MMAWKVAADGAVVDVAWRAPDVAWRLQGQVTQRQDQAKAKLKPKLDQARAKLKPKLDQMTA